MPFGLGEPHLIHLAGLAAPVGHGTLQPVHPFPEDDGVRFLDEQRGGGGEERGRSVEITADEGRLGQDQAHVTPPSR